MTTLTLIAVLGSGLAYILLSARIYSHASALQDHLPIASDRGEARVQNAAEFSAATVATTISLATLVLAYAELAPYLGTWLLWTVVTTAIGISVVRIFAPIIWRKMAQVGAYRPTIHDFLGMSFGSPFLRRVAALCTAVGFLGALAVELTVGTRFLASLAPSVPPLAAVLVLAGIGVAYTALGGFRAVVLTDRIQMWAIWGSIAALSLAITSDVISKGGLSFLAQTVPTETYDFSWRVGLGAFLVGIAVINIPTFLADMSIWQRIAASRDETTVRHGLVRSVVSAAVSWTLLALLACALVGLVPTSAGGENPLLLYLQTMGQSSLGIASILFVVIVAGLYAASLSTASTQLIASAHALHTDLLRGAADKAALAKRPNELTIARWLLVSAAIVAVVIVEMLRAAGFSIADLVFAVYGAQLGLVPPVLIALFAKSGSLQRIGPWAAFAVVGGFVAGWGAAAIGKASGTADLVFLAPAISLGVSTLIVSVGAAGVIGRRR